MRLRDFLEPEAIVLDLAATGREAALYELAGRLRLGERAAQTVVRQLMRRELLGSTGFGSGVAIPHCRTLAVGRLRVAVGVHRGGIDFQAADGKPVHLIFLIVAPPQEVSNQYLPVLGRIAQFVHDPEGPARLRQARTPEEVLALLEARGV